MKNFLLHKDYLKSLFVLIVLAQASVLAQPVIEWNMTWGGDRTDELKTIQQTPDGGYILAGSSSSNASGDKTKANFDFRKDYWIVKLNSNRVKEWDNSYGGLFDAELIGLQQTPDGGYILGGNLYSGIGRDKTVAQPGIWIVKIAADGSKLWDKSYATPFAYLKSIQVTLDGGYILGGVTNTGYIPEGSTNTGYDYGVIKLTADGAVEWDATLGGTGSDWLYSATQTSDGGYMLAGYSNSQAGRDKSDSPKGSSDFWIVKLKSDGNKVWDKSIGGEGGDAAFSHIETTDHGFLIGGISESGFSADKTDSCRGNSDYWVVKVTAKGEIEWDKTFGAAGSDWLTSMSLTPDGGYILSGYTTSEMGGDKSEPSRDHDTDWSDFWIIKIDANGNKKWDKTIGGEGSDRPYSINHTFDNGFIIGRYSASFGFERTAPSKGGGGDYWIVKLAPESPLPVTLSSFTARKENITALLTWSTTSETNNDRFEVQQSLNGKTWNLIATVKSNGDVNKPANYMLIDNKPVLGIENLYRLKIIDADDTFTYSKIESLHFNSDAALKIFPNPASETLNIEMANWHKVKTIELLNSRSDVVYHSGEKPVQNPNIMALSSGPYLIRITLADGSTLVEKVLVGK